jgi:uncharacterized protein (DUF697 family)
MVFTEEQKMENVNLLQEDENNNVNKMDYNADKTIWKYSILAGSTSFIRVPGLDMAGDSILQYKMISQLKKFYSIPDDALDLEQIFAVILDNFPLNKIFQSIGSYLQTVPVIGTISGTVMKFFFKFSYTYLIGKVFKSLFRKSYLENEPIDISNISEIIRENIQETINYVKDNIMIILFSNKKVLEKYEVDLEKFAKELDDTIIKTNDCFEKTYKKMLEAYKEFKLLEINTKEYFDQLDKIQNELNMPTLDFIKSKVELAKLQNKEIDPELEAFIEMLEENNIDELLNQK